MGIFLDSGKLLPDYLPPRLPHREKELKRLHSLFSDFFREKISKRVLIVGGIGVGKTALSQSFGREAEKKQEAHYVHVNCRITSSPYLILHQVMRKFRPTYPVRGFSTWEVLNDLVSHLEKRDERLIVTLDELDFLVETRGPDLLYNLTRYVEQNPQAWRIALIGVSRDPHFLNRLDAPTRSTFMHNLLELSKYTREQLFDILKYRAEEAILPGKVEEECLRLIADMAAPLGDARYALEILYRAGCLAENRRDPEITPEHVREAKASIYPSFPKHRLEGLHPHEVLILLAVARRLRSTRAAYTTSGETYEAYHIACEEYGFKPLVYAQFLVHLDRLRALGMLSAKHFRARGQTTLLSIEEAPVEGLVKELEQLVERRLKRADQSRCGSSYF